MKIETFLCRFMIMHPPTMASHFHTNGTPLKLNRVIGKGTHGTVYSAYHLLMERQVAVKRVRDTPSARHEIRALEELQGCTHIVKYLDTLAEDDSNHLLIVMELCNGTNGEDVIAAVRNGARFSEKTIRCMSGGMMHALLQCHEIGLLYGDIKPSNVIFTPPASEPVMIDFGCSRYGSDFTGCVGTPLYFAPEKFYSKFGLASDTWSLGVLMYMLVAGHHPFVHVPHYDSFQGDIVDLQAEIECTRLSFHHPHWDHISKDMKDLLSHMLQKDPSKRIPIEYAVTHKWFSSANL